METQSFIGGKYQLGKYLGHGSFGQVMSAVNITNQHKVAIKIEPLTDIITNSEAEILKSIRGTEGFPKYYEKIEHDSCSYLVMQRLGNNLYNLLKQSDGKFSINTVALVGLQLCTRLEELHKLGYLHRDIKPHQILTGLRDQARIYLVDFGLSKKYRISSMHIPYKSGCSKAGNATFASLHVHNGIQQSRRDDMESFCYLLLYLLNGKLPWQQISSRNKNEKWNKIALLKSKCNFHKVCATFPNEFLLIINYCTSLTFDATPNYEYIRSQLSKLLGSKILLPDWLNKVTITKNLLGIQPIESESSIGSKIEESKKKSSRKKTIFLSKGPELSQRILQIFQKLQSAKEDTEFELSVESVSHESEPLENIFCMYDSSIEGLGDSSPQSKSSSLGPSINSDRLAVKTSFLYERKETVKRSYPSLNHSVLLKLRSKEESKIQNPEVNVPCTPHNLKSEESRTEQKCLLF